MAQSAVDAELVLASFCGFGIAGQRILGKRRRCQKHKPYDPRSL
jgi:hypothetical protein